MMTVSMDEGALGEARKLLTRFGPAEGWETSMPVSHAIEGWSSL